MAIHVRDFDAEAIPRLMVEEKYLLRIEPAQTSPTG
jgi:hypothetical protein